MDATEGSCEPKGRSIDRILARRRERKRQRRYTRAPDVLHGNCRLDAVYATFGERWVESTAFVEPVVGRGGTELGWTAGRFEDRFLTVAQGVQSEVGDVETWLGEKIAGVDRVIALDIGGASSGDAAFGCQNTIRIESTRPRLRSLEREHLNAARDRDFGRVSGAAEALEERLLQSRVDVMSLICLCARLA